MNGIRSLSRSFSNAANAGDCLGIGSLRRHVLRRPAVGHDDDHRHRLLVGVQVVEDHVGRAAARPLVLVAADAVQQVQDRVLLVLGVPRRRVDLRLALDADRRRVVLDRLQLAALDAVALLVEALGRGRDLRSAPSAGRPSDPPSVRRADVPLLGEQPLEDLRVVVRLGPGVVPGVRIDLQLDVLRARRPQALVHLLGGVEADGGVLAALEDADRQVLELLRVGRVAAPADRDDGGEPLGLRRGQRPGAHAAHAQPGDVHAILVDLVLSRSRRRAARSAWWGPSRTASTAGRRRRTAGPCRRR